jgi:hypothetical protein
MNADPNSGYGCTVATDDMRYSNFTGSSFEDRQDVAMFRRNASTDVNCWADPGSGCFTPFGATVMCQGPNPYSSGNMVYLSYPGPCR